MSDPTLWDSSEGILCPGSTLKNSRLFIQGKETNNFREKKTHTHTHTERGFWPLGQVLVFCKHEGYGGRIGPAYGIKEKLLLADVHAAHGAGTSPSLPIQDHVPHTVTKHWQKYRSHPQHRKTKLGPRCSGLAGVYCELQAGCSQETFVLLWNAQSIVRCGSEAMQVLPQELAGTLVTPRQLLPKISRAPGHC